MDSQVKDLVAKELVTIKARIVLQEVQISALDDMDLKGAQADQVATTKNQTKSQLAFDKVYAAKLEALIGTESPKA